VRVVGLAATTPYLATFTVWRGAVASDYRLYRSLSAMRYCVLQSLACCLQHASVCGGCTVLRGPAGSLRVLVGLGVVAWPVLTSKGQADSMYIPDLQSKAATCASSVPAVSALLVCL